MKSYFAGSVQLAMEQARRELGSEAILVTSRLAPAEAGKPRLYEVVFATEASESSPPPGPARPAALPPPGGSPDPATLDAVLQEIKELRQQMAWKLDGAGSSSAADSRATIVSPQQEMLAYLETAEVAPDLAHRLIASALERLAGSRVVPDGTSEGRFADVLRAAAAKRGLARNDLRDALAGAIADVFPVVAGPGQASEPVVMALIGPPGVGKTSAIAKIAARYGIGGSRPTLVLSADHQRIAASEQLRGYAAVFGLRFELAQSPRALGQLLEDHRSYGLILIDTPGFSESELSEAGGLAQFLSAQTGVQRHLVLPAPARAAHLSRIFSTYEVFRPSHLLFSRMDEATVFGPVLNEAIAKGVPVSFFSTGAGVPENLAEADAAFLANRLLPAKEASLSLRAAA